MRVTGRPSRRESLGVRLRRPVVPLSPPGYVLYFQSNKMVPSVLKCELST